MSGSSHSAAKLRIISDESGWVDSLAHVGLRRRSRIVVEVPARFFIDSHIHDKLADDPDALELAKHLIELPAIVLLSAHVQADEIAKTPDENRVKMLTAVPVVSVPTYGVVVGYSRLGMARLSESEPF